MKLFDIIYEVATETRVEDKLFNTVWNDLFSTTSKYNIALSSTQQQHLKAKLNQEITSGEITRQKLVKMKVSPELQQQMADKLLHVMIADLKDEISDEEATKIAGVVFDKPKPTTPENLPAVITKDLSTEQKGIKVEWSMVKHLPGYIQQPIRALGRKVFKPFTSTRIEDIQVLANLGGGGPNSEMELKAIASWLKTHGVKNTRAKIVFQEILPDYEADFALFDAKGYTFMVVKDFAGHYIYGWPSSTTILLGKQETKQLR